MTDSGEVGDLISYWDNGGALHVAVAYTDYPSFPTIVARFATEGPPLACVSTVIR